MLLEKIATEQPAVPEKPPDERSKVRARIVSTIAKLINNKEILPAKLEQLAITGAYIDRFKKLLWTDYFKWDIEDMIFVYAEACIGQLPIGEDGMGPISMNRWALLHHVDQSHELISSIKYSPRDPEKELEYQAYEAIIGGIEHILYRSVNSPEREIYENGYSDPGTFFNLVRDHMLPDNQP